MSRYALVIAACVLVVACALRLAPEAIQKAGTGDYGLAAALVLLLAMMVVGVPWKKKDP